MLSFNNLVLKSTKNGVFTYSIYKQARILQKLMDTGLRKKKGKLIKNENLASNSFPAGVENEIGSKRMNVLNKTFMLQISGILASGESAAKLQEFDIEITKVRIDKTFQSVKIYWVAGNKKLDEEILSKTLKSVIAELQFEMNSNRLIGKFPNISFVRDLTAENYSKVEKILNSLNLKENESSVKTFSEKIVETLPAMKQDVLGLDYSEIVNKIKIQMKQKKSVTLNNPEEITTNVDKTNNLIYFNKSDFFKFYKSHQILNRKMRNREKLYYSDLLNEKFMENDEE